MWRGSHPQHDRRPTFTSTSKYLPICLSEVWIDPFLPEQRLCRKHVLLRHVQWVVSGQVRRPPSIRRWIVLHPNEAAEQFPRLDPPLPSKPRFEDNIGAPRATAETIAAATGAAPKPILLLPTAAKRRAAKTTAAVLQHSNSFGFVRGVESVCDRAASCENGSVCKRSQPLQES